MDIKRGEPRWRRIGDWPMVLKLIVYTVGLAAALAGGLTAMGYIQAAQGLSERAEAALSADALVVTTAIDDCKAQRLSSIQIIARLPAVWRLLASEPDAMLVEDEQTARESLSALDAPGEDVESVVIATANGGVVLSNRPEEIGSDVRLHQGAEPECYRRGGRDPRPAHTAPRAWLRSWPGLPLRQAPGSGGSCRLVSANVPGPRSTASMIGPPLEPGGPVASGAVATVGAGSTRRRRSSKRHYTASVRPGVGLVARWSLRHCSSVVHQARSLLDSPSSSFLLPAPARARRRDLTLRSRGPLRPQPRLRLRPRPLFRQPRPSRAFTFRRAAGKPTSPIPLSEIESGGPPRDGIPPVDQPKFLSPTDAGAWLKDQEPVIAFELNGDARAYPLQILIWHEIVDDEVGGVPVAITFCPLCNTAIAFDRRVDGQTLRFGTTGNLRRSDLVMWSDDPGETWWQQITGEALVGDLVGHQLTMLPAEIVSFADFKAAYPSGLVLSRDTGNPRGYGNNPYVGYDNINNSPFLYSGSNDGRLPPMERVVTIELNGETAAYPFSRLIHSPVVNDVLGGTPLVVLHQGGTLSALDGAVIAASRDVGAAAAFARKIDDKVLTFSPRGDQFIDDQTSSTWDILGRAIAGPLVGERLDPLVSANHFWFAWAVFRPDTRIWSP